MTVDYPSKNPSGWMPILDLSVRMANDNSVDFKWYKKPVATDYSILNRSAMPAATKRITLVQMGVTMLRNTRQRLHQLLRIPLMEQLAEKMMMSGYPEDFRRGVIESAVVCYEKQGDWGGLWNGCFDTGLDRFGEPLHGSMYRWVTVFLTNLTRAYTTKGLLGIMFAVLPSSAPAPTPAKLG